MSLDYNGREGITPGESHVLLLLSTSGMMILAAARDLIIVFLGIEADVDCCIRARRLNRRRERSAEGAIKYFLLGAFLDRIPVDGIALVYGATGATISLTIRRTSSASNQHSRLLLVGIALLLVGSASRSPLRRSTCGLPMSMRVRRPRLRHTWLRQ